MPDTIDALALLRPLSLPDRVRVYAGSLMANYWRMSSGVPLPSSTPRAVTVGDVTYEAFGSGHWRRTRAGHVVQMSTNLAQLVLDDISDDDLARILALRDAPPPARLLTREEVEAIAALSAEEVVNA